MAVIFAILGGMEVITETEMPWAASYLVVAYWLLGALFLTFDISLLLASWRKSENRVSRIHDTMLLPRESFRALFVWFFLAFLLVIGLFSWVEKTREARDFQDSKNP